MTPEHKANIAAAMRGKRGASAHRFKGGRARRGPYVYILVTEDHPFYCMASQRYIPEHRLVMAEVFGRPLEPEWVVHHENEIKNDNRPENLRVFASQALHTRWHRLTDYFAKPVKVKV